MTYAIEIDAFGGPEALIRKPQAEPSPGPGEIVIRNHAIGLNFIDVYQRTGLYPMALPAIPGCEGAGLIQSVGESVTGLKPGDRVAFVTTSGAYASYTTAPAGVAVKLPNDISFETAAAIFLKGLTARMLTHDVFSLKKGDRALIYAATGGVGSILTPWAAAIGAHVIAVVGWPAKSAKAKALGATDVIDRSDTADIAAAARSLTGGAGVNVAYDSVGAATFMASLDALAPRGMMVTYGNASGPPPEISPLDLSKRGSLSLCRPSLFHYATPEHLPEMAADLFQALAAGAVPTPSYAEYSLADAGRAHEALESGETTGPTILRPEA